MILYIFGNGNLSFEDFHKYYYTSMMRMPFYTSFVLCDFRGVDTLAMEVLKDHTQNVSVYHVGEKPRYYPDSHKTRVHNWMKVGGFSSDESRDDAAIKICTNFLAYDFNSDGTRKSGTMRNIERCLELGKIRIT